MNEQELKTMPEYVQNLPQSVRDFVFDSEWEKRTTEIAKKYSLGDGQTDALANTVVLVLVGLESPDTFLDTLVTDLGVSRLLAEQIVVDLETRVFEYAIKEIESKKTEKPAVEPVVPKAEVVIPKAEIPIVQKIEMPVPKVEPVIPQVAVVTPKVEVVAPKVVITPPKVEPVKPNVPKFNFDIPEKSKVFAETNTEPKSETKIELKKLEEIIIRPVQVPEVKPVNLPMVEKGEVAHDNPTHSPEIKMEIKKIVLPESEAPKVKPVDSNFPTPDVLAKVPEIVQRPVPVPRFMPEAEQSTLLDTTPATETKTSTEKKYVADPYREALN